MADEKQLLWNHYQQLSEEIKAADTLNYQVIGVVVAAAVALLNAAFSKSSFEDRCWILLSIYAVTMPGRFLLEVARTRIWRVASYLEIFIEPELQYVKWQERLNRRGMGRHLPTNIIRTEFWLISGLDLVASALVIATTLGVNDGRRFYFLAGAIVLLLYSLFRASVAHRRFARGGKVHRENRDSWQRLKEAETADSTGMEAMNIHWPT